MEMGKRFAFCLAWLLLANCLPFVLCAEAKGPVEIKLDYAPAPIDNPLKGLVPYKGQGDRFLHSMEFNYIPLSALMKGYGQYDWASLESLLNEVSTRRCQTVFRVFIEYPGVSNAIPEFLVTGGLKVRKHMYANSEPLSPKELVTPDYSDVNLRKAMHEFISALGEKYDGDPRIGFITAGMLGLWGEWHDHPEPFASKEVQGEVLDAYEKAFSKTRILLRYPAGENDNSYAPNAKRDFGYHDDSFAWATLPTGEKTDGWFFMTLMEKAGPDAVEKWKFHPIGGEIRPEAWGKVFDPEPGLAQIQNFHDCVEATHASWLMDSGIFKSTENIEERRKRAEAEVRRMGYEFHIPKATLDESEVGRLSVEIEVENRGVAPFYYDWPVEFGIMNGDRRIVKTVSLKQSLPSVLPNEAARHWKVGMDVGALSPSGRYILLLRIPNPMPTGRQLRFANKTQDMDIEGWLTIGGFKIHDEVK